MHTDRMTCTCYRYLCVCVSSSCEPIWEPVITLIGLQSPSGKSPLKSQVICPPNGTAVLKGSRDSDQRSDTFRLVSRVYGQDHVAPRAVPLLAFDHGISDTMFVEYHPPITQSPLLKSWPLLVVRKENALRSRSPGEG